MLNEAFPECVLMKNGDKITLAFETDADASVGFDAIERLLALPSSPVRELVEALRGCAAMVREGKFEMLSEFWYDESAKLTAEACTEAADRLTALEAENARLRVIEREWLSMESIARLYCAVSAPQGGNHGE